MKRTRETCYFLCERGPHLSWIYSNGLYGRCLITEIPQMPELIGYQVIITKCRHNLEGLVMAQYDRIYRRQVAQTKELHWSRLNLVYFVCVLWAKLGTILLVHIAEVITIPRKLVQTTHCALLFCGSIQVRHFLQRAGSSRLCGYSTGCSSSFQAVYLSHVQC